MGWITPSVKAAQLPWEKVTSLDQCREILEKTKFKPILFFKHSTRCEISTMVLNNFEAAWNKSADLCALYFVDLLANRDVSLEVEKLTGVEHQSPQVIVLNKDEIVYTATHSSISVDEIDLILKNE
jgi:bacillithiol system protein YtxJ